MQMNNIKNSIQKKCAAENFITEKFFKQKVNMRIRYGDVYE